MRLVTDPRWLLRWAGLTLLLGVLGWALLPIVVGPAAHVNDALQAMWIATLGTAAGAWSVLKRPDGPRDRLVAAATLAAMAPIAMVPWAAVDDLPRFVGLVVATLATWPLLLELLRRAAGGRAAVRRAEIVLFAALLVALAACWIAAGGGDDRLRLRYATVAVPLVVLSLFALGAAAQNRPGSRVQRRVTETLLVAAAGILPLVTNVPLLAIPDMQLFIAGVVAAGVMALLLTRLAIRPLANAAERSQVHRDLVIAAAEAERTRLAQLLHDGPLGDITLLVQRLDAAGDADNAAIAMAIASDLRTIGNDLQLPILDDLGAGPALEWLVARVARRAGRVIHLEVDASGRPPRPVELAIYRVAQEAIVNAVKHGTGAVSVRYRSAPAAAFLTVEDAGPGLAPDAIATAGAAGRLGLLAMTQRAEAVGAQLELSNAATGGARVGLSWTASA